MSEINRRKILSGEITLTRSEESLLEAAGHQVVERRKKSAKSFDRLAELGLISASGAITIEGARALRGLKKRGNSGES